MNDDIHEMKQSQHLALRARTTIGRIRVVFGIIFSIVLVVRVVLASKSLSLLFQDQQETLQSPRDPVTSILLWLIGNNIVSEDQYNDLAQGTSLVLAGMLSTSQVRSFLRVINALGRKLNRMFGKSLRSVTCREGRSFCCQQRSQYSGILCHGLLLSLVCRFGENELASRLSSIIFVGCWVSWGDKGFWFQYSLFECGVFRCFNYKRSDPCSSLWSTAESFDTLSAWVTAECATQWCICIDGMTRQCARNPKPIPFRHLDSWKRDFNANELGIGPSDCWQYKKKQCSYTFWSNHLASGSFHPRKLKIIEDTILLLHN